MLTGCGVWGVHNAHTHLTVQIDDIESTFRCGSYGTELLLLASLSRSARVDLNFGAACGARIKLIDAERGIDRELNLMDCGGITQSRTYGYAAST
jgi:hypothetical protein